MNEAVEMIQVQDGGLTPEGVLLPTGASAMLIWCGDSSPHRETEARFRALRAEQGEPPGTHEGCGKKMHWTFAYRCLNCARFMHAQCLQRHFESSHA